MTARRIAISGASGLVGRPLASAFTAHGDTVLRVVRRQARSDDEIGWDPDSGLLEPGDAEGLDAFVHLAGESIAAARWTSAKKRRIHESRGPATERLVRSLGELERPPTVFACASASGYFGDRGDEVLDESAPPGEGFLADVCRSWEAAAEGAQSFADRVLLLRFGVVLARDGGALERMLPPFRLGLGGPIGDGEQYFPWIALDDLVNAIRFLVDSDEATGAVHMVSPQTVTNQEFTATLGQVLGRPTVLRVPAFAMRLALGDMAEQLLLASCRMVPGALQELDFDFDLGELERALRQCIT